MDLRGLSSLAPEEVNASLYDNYLTIMGLKEHEAETKEAHCYHEESM